MNAPYILVWYYYNISKRPYDKDDDGKEGLVHCYYSKQYPTPENNDIFKKVIYSKDKISEYEVFDNNSDLKLVSEIFLKYNNLDFDIETSIQPDIESKTCIAPKIKIYDIHPKFNYTVIKKN